MPGSDRRTEKTGTGIGERPKGIYWIGAGKAGGIFPLFPGGEGRLYGDLRTGRGRDGKNRLTEPPEEKEGGKERISLGEKGKRENFACFCQEKGKNGAHGHFLEKDYRRKERKLGKSTRKKRKFLKKILP